MNFCEERHGVGHTITIDDYNNRIEHGNSSQHIQQINCRNQLLHLPYMRYQLAKTSTKRTKNRETEQKKKRSAIVPILLAINEYQLSSKLCICMSGALSQNKCFAYYQMVVYFGLSCVCVCVFSLMLHCKDKHETNINLSIIGLFEFDFFQLQHQRSVLVE